PRGGARGASGVCVSSRPRPPQTPASRAGVGWSGRGAPAPAAVVTAAPQGPIVDYYLKDRLPSYSSNGGASPDAVAAALARRLAGSREVWFVRYSAGTWDNPIGRWLETNAFFVRDQWVTQNHLATYALAPPGSLEDRPVSAGVSDLVEIIDARTGPSEVRPGERVLVGLRWASRAPEPRRIPPSTKVSLRLIDPWGEPIDK